MVATLTTRRATPADSPVNPTPLGEFTRVGDLIHQAVSRDGIWFYERCGDFSAAHFAIWHLPTGIKINYASSLLAARQATARSTAMAAVQFWVDTRLDGRLGEVQQLRAVVLQRILAAKVLPPSVEPESRCYCGGYVTRINYRWMHVDTCSAEADRTDAPALCPDGRLTHVLCDTPEAVKCEHNQCNKPNNLWTPACALGHTDCCGTHDGER